MIISLNWLKKYVDLSGVEVEELVKLVGARLVEVEGVKDVSEKYRGIRVVEVRECERIEGSDHLSRCVVWDGAGEYQVVCGANNVRTGMLAAWLPAGTVVPESFEGAEPFVLEKRKLMGVESNGMLASMRELCLGDDHSGIVEINPNMSTTAQFRDGRWPRGGRNVEAGDDFAVIFGLDDVLLDIENKSLTHRPDCFGVIGFAREVAGILGRRFEAPRWLGESVGGNMAKSAVKDSKQK
jgi:phenylalanyl-tRNA synthetase beta chain